MKGAFTIDFLEKGATVNNTSYCQLLKQNSPNLVNDPHNSSSLSKQFITLEEIFLNEQTF